MTEIKIVMLENCEDLMPKKAHFDDAAFDLRSRVDMVLPVRKSVVVPAGFSIELPVGFEAQIRPRSGLALKHDLMLTNSPGTVDAGYRGEVGVIMYNGGTAEFPIKRGDRIAQMMFLPVLTANFLLTEALDETERGAGGFGSTGTN